MKIIVLVNFQRWDFLMNLAGQLEQAHWQWETVDWCFDEYKDRDAKARIYFRHSDNFCTCYRQTEGLHVA